MPEFEETESKPNPSHSYTPSAEAPNKPRGRRRSGGFKTEVASSSTAGMGEVSASDALKSEKLSGGARPQQREERPKRERKPRAERAERPERPERVGKEEAEAPKPAREKREPREPRAHREPRAPREERITNPQPSEATLASIKRVEAQITERRAERDARHAEREKNRPAKGERAAGNKSKNPQPKGKAKQAAKKKGLLASILGFFGIGNEPEKKPAGNRGGKNRQGGNRNGNRNGNRSSQNRQGGNRGGQNRRGGNRGGQGRRQGDQKPHSAKSLSNES